MSEEIHLSSYTSKEDRYKELLPQIEALLSEEANGIANMANITAVLKEAFNWLWVGFYLHDQKNLVLGPFQGPLACTRIDFNKGVCGAAYSKKETVIVSDVNAFPGHIACSALSKSEIVIPGIKGEKVLFVLDIDSDQLSSFDETDKKYLEQLLDILLKVSF